MRKTAPRPLRRGASFLPYVGAMLRRNGECTAFAIGQSLKATARGKEIDMFGTSLARNMMLMAAVPMMLSASAVAQTADQAPAAGEEPPPPPAAVEAPATPGTDGTTSADTMAMDAMATGGEPEILTEESENQVLAAKIIGMHVVNSAGDAIGKVDDVLLDKSGAISGLVLSSGGILGLGAKKIAIQWQDLAAIDTAEVVTVNLTSEQVEAAPEFRTKEQLEAEALRNAEPTAPPPTTGPATATPVE